MNLNISDWKSFKTSKLFHDMQNGKANQQLLEDGNSCFYIGAKKEDNGVMIHCKKDESLITKGNCIIFICNGEGSVGYANYMDVDFIGTTDIVAGYNDNLNQYVGAFLATIYSQERPKYSFGRKWKTHLADTQIKLPIKHDLNGEPLIDSNYEYSDEGYIPDWNFMEDYIKTLHSKPLTTKIKSGKTPPLNISEWKSFQLKKLFIMLNGKGITQVEIEDNPGDFAAVQSSEENNGVMGKIDLNYCKSMNYTYTEKPCLTVARSGSAGFVSYQAFGCVVGDSAKILLLPDDIATESNYLFLQTLLTANRFKYSYGRKVTEEKYLNEYISLPIQYNNNLPFIDKTYRFSEEGFIPDWQYIKKYIESLPYSDRLKG